MKNKRVIKQYSLAFKQKVVGEIERGKYSFTEARRVYDIGGGSVIQNWAKKLGRFDALNEIVVVKMKGEKSRLRGLQQQIRELKEALADEHLKNKCLEKVIELAGKNYQEDLKKNFAGKSSTVSGNKKR
jgi:transposase-like protein